MFLGFIFWIIDERKLVDNSGNPFEQVFIGFCFNASCSSGVSPNTVISFNASYINGSETSASSQ